MDVRSVKRAHAPKASARRSLTLPPKLVMLCRFTKLLLLYLKYINQNLSLKRLRFILNFLSSHLCIFAFGTLLTFTPEARYAVKLYLQTQSLNSKSSYGS